MDRQTNRSAEGNRLAATSALSTLIAPVTPPEFFDTSWDQAYLHIPGSAGRFDDILKESDFCEALFAAYLGDDRIKFFHKSHGTQNQSQDHFLRQKAQWPSPLTLNELAIELRSGTLVFNGIEKRIETLQAWCRDLYRDMNCWIAANAYFSAGTDASAFDAHFDEQDVFILQIEGEKEWRLWTETRVENPAAGYPKGDVVVPKLPADITVTLTAGDCLYVPRGVWHWPRSLNDQPSLHVTTSMIMPQPKDVLTWLNHKLCQDGEMRAPLPFPREQSGNPIDHGGIDAAFRNIERLLSDPDRNNNAVNHMTLNALQSLRDHTKEDKT